MTKRKAVKPRTRMTVQRKMVEIDVVPKGMFSWVVKAEGREINTARRQEDAQSLAVFLGRLTHKATVRFHDRKGRITEERTFPTSADPRRSPG